MLSSSRSGNYVSVNRHSSEDEVSFELEDANFQSTGLTSTSYDRRQRPPSVLGAVLSILDRLWSDRPASRSLSDPRHKRVIASSGSLRRLFRSLRRCCFPLYLTGSIFLALVIFTAIFRPSYTVPPKHYRELRQRVESSQGRSETDHYAYGTANEQNEKIFIAASLYDQGGHLLRGAWGREVLKLLDILGNRNVFLSIYENGGGGAAEQALFDFDKQVQCPHSVVYDVDFTIDEVPTIALPDGSERTKRVAYLAEMRNKALLPMLEDPRNHYDKLLFLNDVVFDPVEAAQLLMSTNLNDQGRTSYRAACAVDFINPFKFYDTYATRDLQGYSMGVPFFPWFTNAGDGSSRRDVLEEKDAVRVKSCWGGMVAFDARPFQAEQPLRFRATEESDWDASECCLIHADLMKTSSFTDQGDYVGVYINPFIRVAYSNTTLRWLSFTRRFERLYTVPHTIINRLVGLPWFNPRRLKPDDNGFTSLGHAVESYNGTGTGSTMLKTQQTSDDGFCGVRMLQLIKEAPKEGERNWEIMPIPPE